MGLILADLGAAMILEAVLNDNWPVGGKDLTMKLFVNDITPADDDVAGDYTEAEGGDYAAKTLLNGSWTVAPDGGGIVTGTYALQTWTFTGPLDGGATIYGYFIIDADGVLVYAEPLTPTFTPANNGDQYKVTPKFQLSKGTPT